MRVVDELSCNLPCSGGGGSGGGAVERCGGELAIDLYSYRPTAVATAVSGGAYPTEVSSTTRMGLPHYRQ